MDTEEEKFIEGKFRWKIEGFTNSAGIERCSDKFTFDGSKWNMLLYPDHSSNGHFKVFIEGTEPETLPIGSRKEIDCSIKVLNQNGGTHLVKPALLSEDQQASRRYFSIFDLSELLDLANGYVVNDTLILKAEVHIRNKIDPQPKADSQLNEIRSHITSLEDFIRNCSVADGYTWFREDVSLEEVRKAKKFLRERFSGAYLSDKLLTTLANLSSAKSGLSPKQKGAVESFLANFEIFIRDVHSCEEDRVNFMLKRLRAEQAFMTVKANYNILSLYKEARDALSQLKEGRPLEEEKESDWNAMKAEIEKVKSECAARAKRLEVAGTRLKKAMERMRRADARFSELKAQFT